MTKKYVKSNFEYGGRCLRDYIQSRIDLTEAKWPVRCEYLAKLSFTMKFCFLTAAILQSSFDIQAKMDEVKLHQTLTKKTMSRFLFLLLLDFRFKPTCNVGSTTLIKVFYFTKTLKIYNSENKIRVDSLIWRLDSSLMDLLV